MTPRAQDLREWKEDEVTQYIISLVKELYPERNWRTADQDQINFLRGVYTAIEVMENA